MKATPLQFLTKFNKTYFKLHKNFEELFWVSYMGDHSVNKRKDAALAKRDAFRADAKNLEQVEKLLLVANDEEKRRLNLWKKFFMSYQSPKEAIPLKKKIDKLESVIQKKRGTRKEGYIDPYTKKFVVASANKMGSMMTTNSDEKIRKACFDAREKLALTLMKEYLQLVKLRNQYAKKLGYTDFYDYKVQREDGMTKEELFGLFKDIYEKTKYAKDDIRKLEKTMPGLRKPWNFSYLMSGSFRKEEDPYYQFDEALIRWGKSFAALGIDLKGSKLQLDLLDRKGKYNNGFCHWPEMVHFENGKRKPGSSNFTCNVVLGQIGEGASGMHTLFHEGGHAAHMLNIQEEDVCVNHEYAPMSTSWSETQSMFLDTMYNSIDWRTRYAKNAEGKAYPFDLYERRLRKLHILNPLALNGIIIVADFEREIYESKNLTSKKVQAIARKMYNKYSERSQSSIGILNTPHLYSWESSASYHGYGLAELAVEQWRKYFYDRYDYIVDNPHVGKEMEKVWALGASKTFSELVELATGEKLSAKAFLDNVTMPIEKILERSKNRIAKLHQISMYEAPINLNASIKMVSGKKTIATNAKSFEDMAEKYKEWLKAQ